MMVVKLFDFLLSSYMKLPLLLPLFLSCFISLKEKMKLRIYLNKDTEKANNDGQFPVIAAIRINKKYTRKVIANVYQSSWNEKTRRIITPRPGAKDNNSKEINERLEKLESEFPKFILKCQVDQKPITENLVKQFLENKRIYTGKEKPFWDAYQEYLDLLNVAEKTKQNYELYHTKLKEFETETGYFIDYSTITPAFNVKYKDYILVKKNLSWNTYATAIKKLKFFMVWALNMEYHDEISFRKFSVTEKEPVVIHLTEDELKKLYSWDFQNKRLNRVRDIFCFGCFTGLAFADIFSLRHEHIQNETIIKHRKKSKKRIETPLCEPALGILRKHSGKISPLPAISNDKLNEYIRECARISGLSRIIVYKKFTGGKEIEQTAPLHTILSSHHARKTFITLYYERTKDYIGAKKNAGISQDGTMNRYLDFDKKQARETMNKAFPGIETREQGPEREDFII